MHDELTYRKNSYTLKAFALLYCPHVAFENYPEDTVLEPA